MDQQPKKRGRKPKEKAEPPLEPKKRGRKPKEKIYSVIREPVIFKIDSISNNLLHLDKLKKEDIFKEKGEPENLNQMALEPYEEDHSYKSQPKIATEPQPYVDTFANKNIKKFNILPTIFENKDSWPMKSDIHCWWCCYEFDTIPIPLPMKLLKDKNGEEVFKVKGCFCSFNCCKAYSRQNKMYKQDLILYFFKKMFFVANSSDKKEYYKNDTVYNFDIKQAPDKYLLSIFGGPLTIKEFRESFHNSKNYQILPFPVRSENEHVDYTLTGNSKYKVKEHSKQYHKQYESQFPVSANVDDKEKEDKKTPKPLQKNTLEHLMSMKIT